MSVKWCFEGITGCAAGLDMRMKDKKGPWMILRFLASVIKYMVVPVTEMENVGMGKIGKVCGIESGTLFQP